MIIIACTSNCIHQSDGRCTLDNVKVNTLSSCSDCIYFEEKASKNSEKKEQR